MAVNLSIPGIVFKLKLFGIAGLSFPAAKVVGWVYTVVAAWAIVVLSRRPLPEQEKPLAWIAIITIATLRSPFLPQGYAAFPSLWLLTLFAALYQPNAKTLFLTVAGWAALGVFWPIDWPMDPRLLALLSAVPQAMLIVLPALIVRRALAPARTFVSQGAAVSPAT